LFSYLFVVGESSTVERSTLISSGLIGGEGEGRTERSNYFTKKIKLPYYEAFQIVLTLSGVFVYRGLEKLDIYTVTADISLVD
jgi:hypothetical protein